MTETQSELKGKRLLLLGAHVLMRHAIDRCRAMGIYTIVTDYVPGAPAKKFADEAYDISTLNEDAIVELAKEKHVDGIFTGYEDINITPCARICARLGFPFYATLDQIDRTLNKRKYKNMCRKHGIPVVDDIAPDLCHKHPERVKCPVIVKPADSYSSKGISVCETAAQLAPALQKARRVSKCGEIVVEPFIKADDVFLYFTVQDGLLSLSAMADRLLSDDQPGYAPQPLGYFFPSRYIDIYYATVHDNLQRMIDDLGFRNGSFSMQGFAMEGRLVFFEMGLRLSGGCAYLQISHQNEIDQCTMHIRYALTGKFDGWDLREYDNPRFKKPACVVVILLRNGTIARVDGLNKVLEHPAVFDILQLRDVGDVLTEAGTLNQVFARIYLCADDRPKLNAAIKFVKQTLHISDTTGQNMILNLVDENKAY